MMWSCCKCNRANNRRRSSSDPWSCSYRGFWKCCRCTHVNNPAFSPQRCGSCGHAKGGCCHVFSHTLLEHPFSTSQWITEYLKYFGNKQCSHCGHTKCPSCKTIKNTPTLPDFHDHGLSWDVEDTSDELVVGTRASLSVLWICYHRDDSNDYFA